MKKAVLWMLVLVLAFSLCACKSSSSGGEISSQPTEAPAPAIEILAPLDIYGGNTPADSNVKLTIQEGYKLIQDMGNDEYPYCHSYYAHSGRYGYIAIVPILLEADLQGRTMLYKAKTNLSGFFGSNADHFPYLGKEASHERYFNWRGEDLMPKDIRDTEKPEHAWVDILIIADDHVVGFAVLEIVHWDVFGSEYSYTIEDRYTEYYPIINGEFQEIDEEFVWQRIEQYHNYASS